MNRMFFVVICLVRSVCLLFSMTMMNRTCVLDFVPTVVGLPSWYFTHLQSTLLKL